jgi:hypothetical protein
LEICSSEVRFAPEIVLRQSILEAASGDICAAQAALPQRGPREVDDPQDGRVYTHQIRFSGDRVHLSFIGLRVWL